MAAAFVAAAFEQFFWVQFVCAAVSVWAVPAFSEQLCLPVLLFAVCWAVMPESAEKQHVLDHVCRRLLSFCQL